MNAEERRVLAALNAELEARGLHQRVTRHQFFPMRRVLSLQLDAVRLMRYWTAFRRLDVFTEHPKGSGWGSTKTIGDYTGRGWLPRLVNDAADVVEGKKP